jgi:anti-sigma regulatory factor (Ser/Thr protein kinase)
LHAVEHGNLGITYADKSHLLYNDLWHEEIQRRMALDENRDKRVCVHFERRPHALTITVRDEGHGFDWQHYLDFEPSRAFDLNGRGIALARAKSFDLLEYQGNGNTVTATIRVLPR